jgi:hypothetical protein
MLFKASSLFLIVCCCISLVVDVLAQRQFHAQFVNLLSEPIDLYYSNGHTMQKMFELKPFRTQWTTTAEGEIRICDAF